MRITCPHCGERALEELSYLGDATKHRPEGMSASEDAAFDYVYVRANPAGPHREYWYHASGCRSWLVVKRDTRTHEILGVVAARDVKRSEAGA